MLSLAHSFPLGVAGRRIREPNTLTLRLICPIGGEGAPQVRTIVESLGGVVVDLTPSSKPGNCDELRLEFRPRSFIAASETVVQLTALYAVSFADDGEASRE